MDEGESECGGRWFTGAPSSFFYCSTVDSNSRTPIPKEPRGTMGGLSDEGWTIGGVKMQRWNVAVCFGLNGGFGVFFLFWNGRKDAV